MKNSVEVTILGQHYTVRSESNPEDVRRVAAFVNQRINEAHSAARTANSFTAVVLALLNVAGELVQARSQGAGGGDEEDRLQQLLSRVEAACKEVDADPLTSARNS